MKKGFTLIELVIVIGILAILATVVILVLNPAQLLAQARDSQRMSDLGSIKSAIALYLATAAAPAIGEDSKGSYSTVCWFGAACVTACSASTSSSTVDGTGWMDTDLTLTTGGSALSALPLDPLQTAASQYTYEGENTDKTFELNAQLESTKYQPLEDKDGGNCASVYEIGTDPGLNL